MDIYGHKIAEIERGIDKLYNAIREKEKQREEQKKLRLLSHGFIMNEQYIVYKEIDGKGLVRKFPIVDIEDGKFIFAHPFAGRDPFTGRSCNLHYSIDRKEIFEKWEAALLFFEKQDFDFWRKRSICHAVGGYPSFEDHIGIDQFRRGLLETQHLEISKKILNQSWGTEKENTEWNIPEKVLK